MAGYKNVCNTCGNGPVTDANGNGRIAYCGYCACDVQWHVICVVCKTTVDFAFAFYEHLCTKTSSASSPVPKISPTIDSDRIAWRTYAAAIVSSGHGFCVTSMNGVDFITDNGAMAYADMMLKAEKERFK